MDVWPENHGVTILSGISPPLHDLVLPFAYNSVTFMYIFPQLHQSAAKLMTKNETTPRAGNTLPPTSYTHTN
jgi:hypothetical protein